MKIVTRIKKGNIFMGIVLAVIIIGYFKLQPTVKLCEFKFINGKVDSIAIPNNQRYFDVFIFDSISKTRINCCIVSKANKILVGDIVEKNDKKNIMYFYRKGSDVPYYEHELECD